MEFVAHRLPPDRQEIQSYRPGGFTVSGVRHEGSLLLTAERALPLAVDAIGLLGIADLAPVLETDPAPDLVLLGTGLRFALPPPQLLHDLRAHGMAVEFMSTAAACRTFNLLVAEERRVAAVLIALAAE